MSRGQVPYVDHAWRHLPGGTDPLPTNGPVYWVPYRYAITDEGTEDDLGPDGTSNFGPRWNEYAGWLISPPHVSAQRYEQVSGSLAVVVTDATGLGGVTFFRVEPGSSLGSSSGTGPYWDIGGVYGHGYVGRPSIGDPAVFDEWHAFSLYAYDHYYMDMRLSDGTRVNGTNPITLDVDDQIGAFWQTFATVWD